MQFEVVHSKQNNSIKRIKSLYMKKYRDKENSFIVEGLRCVSLICENEPTSVEKVLVTEEYLEKIDFYIDEDKFLVCSNEVFMSIPEAVNAQGILAVCKKYNNDINDTIKNNNVFLIVCENIQDPGNAGTLIRTADSVGADGIIFTKGSVDIYNPKVIRSTAGAILNIKVFENLSSDEIIDLCKVNNIWTYGTSLDAESFHYDVKYKQSLGIFLGNEANGLRKETQEKLDSKIKIEMCGRSESLNVGVAGSVVAYEILRQIRKGGKKV